MTGVPKGVAHVSFPGGGVFLPTRSPYDRQMLTELVTDRARTKGRVQVLVDDQRWMVHGNAGPRARACGRCRGAVGVVCYAATNRKTGYCVHCALAETPAMFSSSQSTEPSQS